MIKLRWEEGCEPKYMTGLSSGCDLVARADCTIEAGEVGLVKTGVFIESVDVTQFNKSIAVPELQIRCRSSMAYRARLFLANGVGTIDADYKDEIGVLLYNANSHTIQVEKGDRVAQLVAGISVRISDITAGGERTGGFGSSGK